MELSQTLNMADADVRFWPMFFNQEDSEAYLRHLVENIAWEEKQVVAEGGTFTLPRLIAWYGDAGSYTYSGLTMHPHLWTPELLQIKARVEQVAATQFNSVLLNLYRNQNDIVSWHSDDEPELGQNPLIASISFGVARSFQFKRKDDPAQRAEVELSNGSLLLMAGATQHYWKHQIPKSKTPVGTRLNLTFRHLIKP